jgi:hypothetical protein
VPSDDGRLYQAIFDDGAIYGCELSYAGTVLTMEPGFMVVAGREMENEVSEDYTINQATSGFAQLVLTIDLTKTATTTAFNQVSIDVRYASSESGFPDLIQQDINGAGTKYQIQLALVSLGAGGITGIVDNMPTASLIGSGRITAIIAVTYPEGSVCTATDGTKTLRAKDTSGTALFNVTPGEWTVTATDGVETATETVTITEAGQVEKVTLHYVLIYGIMRDISTEDTSWTRTDDSVGFSATASVGTVAGSSDFDNCYPWSEMHRVTLSTEDVMVYIPKFWFQRYREGNVEYIKIADKATEDFKLHPFFSHGDVERDFGYIAAYRTSSNNKSVSGATPQSSKTPAAFRTSAQAKGAGWGLIDLSAWSAIQMLYLVEFADNNSQAKVGYGVVNRDYSTGCMKTGTCDSVPNLTGRAAGTNGLTDVVYRGIEAPWGNMHEITDGCARYGNTYYVCNTPEKYTSTTADIEANYTKLSYTNIYPSGEGYITAVGLDPAFPHIMLGTAVGGSSSTYYADTMACSVSSWCGLSHASTWNSGQVSGIFFSHTNNALTISSELAGSRLIYIPQDGEEAVA